MKKTLKNVCYAVFAAVLLFHVGSCKDPVISDPSNSLNFATLNLAHIDTCTVQFNTVPDRPLLSSLVSTGVIGSMNDIFFGRTYAGLYAQCLLLNGSEPPFSSGILDSAVLSMPYLSDSARYGRCTTPIDIMVYEVSQDMTPGATYFTNQAFSIYPQPIGQRLNFVPDMQDSVFTLDPAYSVDVPTDGQAPQMRVRLSNSFAKKLFTAPDSVYLASQPFIEYFKGLYITTNPNKVGNGVMYFALNNSFINLYFHHPGTASTQLDTSIFQMGMSTYGVTVNHFDHYYAGTLTQQALAHPSPKGDKYGYIQAGGGTKLKLTIPYLKNIDSVRNASGKRVPIGVVKAELVMPVLDTVLADPSYHLPPSIIIYRVDDTLAVQALSTYDNSGAGYLSTRMDNNGKPFLCYVFNLTEYVQKVLNGVYSNINGYYVGFSYTVRADRAILLNDPVKLSTQTKLNITYTLLQQ